MAGIKKWLARRGAVGGTARWAGRLYWGIKKRAPAASINQVMTELVSARYQSRPDIRDHLLQVIRDNRMRGLAHLVVQILSIEAGFSENTQENRSLFMDIINEELVMLAVPHGDIYEARA